MAYKLGAFEMRLTFTPHDGSDPVEVISTPSAFALADEWVDTIRARGEHTPEWCDRMFGSALFLLAAQDAGLAPSGPVTTTAIAELLNAYDVDMDDPGADEGPNPTTGGPEAAQDAS